MFGDAFSPYLIGALADAFKPMISPNTNGTVLQPDQDGNYIKTSLVGSQYINMSPEEYDLEFRALEYSLFSCCFFQVIRKTISFLEAILNCIFLQALGAFFFFVVSFYVINDKLRAERQIASNADLIVAQESSSQPIYRGPAVDT